MIRFLGCGSSSRRGATGWTDPLVVRRLLVVLSPDFVADGESPSGGADDIVHSEAVAYYLTRGLDPNERALRYPMQPELDSQGGFLHRNQRMGEDFRPHVGASFVVGKVGERVGTRGNYLSNGSQNMVDWLRRNRVPTVVYRENGVEPCRNLEEALTMLRALYRLERDEQLVAPGQALKALAEGGGDREQVLLALSCARETSRFAPWLGAVEGAVRS